MLYSESLGYRAKTKAPKQRSSTFFSSHGLHKLTTKILRPAKKVYFFGLSDKKTIGTILIHSESAAIVVLAVVIFFLF